METRGEKDQWAAIILCGGKSSRMGHSKAMLPFGPERMLQRVVRIAREVVDQAVVVAAEGQELPPLPADVEMAYDRAPDRGPLEGLAAGLRALQGRADAVYATSCDVPLLKPEFIRRIFAELGAEEIAVAREEKFFHPLAAVYRPSVLPRIESLLAADRLRPFYLFAECASREVPVEVLRAVDPQLESLSNLNRPADYQAALQKAGIKVEG